jgi:hypothetical protein
MDDQKDQDLGDKPEQTLAERLAKYPRLARLTIETGAGPISIIGVGVPEEPEEAKTDETKQEPKP